jgi:uncharacterized membrane protein YdjX (TVP38/TMEM64 family)
MDLPVNDEKKGKDESPGFWRPVLLLGAVILVIALSRVFGVGEQIARLKDWIGGLGAAAPLAFAALYVLATVAALPGSVLSLAAGALFGPVLGVLTVITAATIGASLAFLVSRYFARQAVARWLEKNERFKRLDNLTEKHGGVIVAITRLVPLFPFNLLNYGFGLTKVSFRTYVVWSALCMLPGTILYVVGSAAVFETASGEGIPWVLVLVVFFFLGLIAFLARKAKNKLAADGTPPGTGKEGASHG